MTLTFLKLAFTFAILMGFSAAVAASDSWHRVGVRLMWVCSFGAGLSIIAAIWLA